ncbi:MAG: glycosyltransferase [Elusimicrobia bacterium]|nr:glycosyltransferase [Elusimicrobiota bacterium]
MKVAIVHDWLTGMRGGEKCLEVFSELFPKATLFTLVHMKGVMSDIIENMEIRTSFLQKFPNIEKRYRHYLPFMPKAIEQFDLTGYDLILSSSHCVAKGIKVPKDSLHICYCYTPMRYIWDMYEQYFGNSSFPTKIAMKFLRPYLQKWDVKSSKSVKYFIAISDNVKERIKRHYNRGSIVIYPPVDTDFYTPTTAYGSTCSPSRAKSRDSLLPTPYYLIVSAFAPYKRVDLAIETFNILGYPLKIIGRGQNERKLKKIARKNIEFLGWRDNNELKKYYQNCKALVFSGEEDFGIVPVEAQSCGKPVIAYKKGGALETIVDRETGIFFENQTVESLINTIKKFENIKFAGNVIRNNALKFSRKSFKDKIAEFIQSKISEKGFK